VARELHAPFLEFGLLFRDPMIDRLITKTPVSSHFEARYLSLFNQAVNGG
jgi:hypothetical protein